MVVAVYTVALLIPESHSLKDKRRVLMSLRSQITKKFNVSIAEIDHHDLWQKATFGIACVATEQRHANQVLDQAVNIMYQFPLLDVISCHKEFV